MAAGAAAAAWIFQARCLLLCWPEVFDNDTPAPASGFLRSLLRRKRHGFALAGMPVGLDDLKTSILVTGVTGSSKTAGVLLPAAAQLLAAYNDEQGAFQKLGALVPEVKGDLVDAFIYLAHEAGRCVCKDVLILAPAGRIPVVRYSDERGRRWFLSARGGAGGSDAADFLPSARHSAGRPLLAAAFENPAEAAALGPLLGSAELALGDRRPRFVGWRWRGSRLLRVGRTRERDRPEPLAGPAGQALWADPPRILKFEDVLYVDNGVRYNLVDARLPAAEAAERLVKLAAMARGSAQKGENEYFYDQARKLIAACISLHRAVCQAPCTVADIVRLATRDDALGQALDALERRAASSTGREASAGRAPSFAEASAQEARRRASGPLQELAAFFREDWSKMVADGKTANIVKSVISGAFGPLLQDSNLAETFCSPSTFSFEDLIQSGRIVGLVPGSDYEQLGRLIGTACKMDFQSSMLARNSRKDLNAGRLVLYFADECHKYATSGSATAGDPYFMNLSRSNNVVNLCATQSYAWLVEVLGREAANVYISAFGVQFWLQQTDPETCRRAAEICGLVTRERVGSEEELDAVGLAGALRAGKVPVLRRTVREEERPRFRPEDFALLDVGEVVAYNKGRPGRRAKAVKGRVRYLACTRKPEGPAAVNARVREYYREILENLAYDRGEPAIWDAEERAA